VLFDDLRVSTADSQSHLAVRADIEEIRRNPDPNLRRHLRELVTASVGVLVGVGVFVGVGVGVGVFVGVGNSGRGRRRVGVGNAQVLPSALNKPHV
jgi:hypothetical protein